MFNFLIFLIAICYASTVLTTIPLIWKIVHTILAIHDQKNCTPGLAIFYLAIYMAIALCSALAIINTFAYIYIYGR